MHDVGWQWRWRAMVFSEPVRAMATMSEPERMRGMILLLPKFLYAVLKRIPIFFFLPTVTPS